MHGIGGSSSGAIAAFTVAWERPDHFRKVLSNVGSFVNLRGGHVYPEKVLASEKKPIRVFLCDGRNDNRGLRNGVTTRSATGSYQNVRLMKALTQKGYDVNYSWGMNLHGQKFGGAIMPEMMRWLWRDGPVSTDVNDMIERSFRQPAKRPPPPRRFSVSFFFFFFFFFFRDHWRSQASGVFSGYFYRSNIDEELMNLC